MGGVTGASHTPRSVHHRPQRVADAECGTQLWATGSGTHGGGWGGRAASGPSHGGGEPLRAAGSLPQAKAPNAVVLVVGTHLDLIEAKFRVERIATLRAYVLALCRAPSGSRATGFPDITFKHLQ